MATRTKKTTKKKDGTQTIQQNKNSMKYTKKQLALFAIHEAAAKVGGELARAGILKDYKKPK